MNRKLVVVNVLVLGCVLMFAAIGVCRATSATKTPALATESRALPSAAQADISPAAKISPAQLLARFDVAALAELSKKNRLISIFEKGGPIMWPLLLASILALGTVIDRAIFLIGVRSGRNKKTLRTFLDAIGRDDIDGASRIGESSKDFVVRALAFALQHQEKSLPNALLYAQEQEMKRFRSGIAMLDTVITLAPLLGLLGTVTGMMGSFALIGGELSTPGAITGGIAEALIATAFGLGIAITSLLPFNYLNTAMEEARISIETAASELKVKMRSRKAEPETVQQPVRPSLPGIRRLAHAEQGA